MRRLLAFALGLLLLAPCALAEDDCICGQPDCVCFIQLGDGGMAVEAIQNALVEQGYLQPNDDASGFDEATRQAVMAFQTAHELSPTGMMDDSTLTLLLWGMTPEELDEADPLSIGLLVWVPTDCGIRHHKRESCCDMLDPRLISRRNALRMEMEPCGRCQPTGLNTELYLP